LVRLVEGSEKECKQALDAGAGGVIIPNLKTAEQLTLIREFCQWPPSGKRGVGFSRANLFGKNFKEYNLEAQSPLLIAMIENIEAVDQLDSILKVNGLDAILIGPYDLSASLNATGDFESELFNTIIKKIKKICNNNEIPIGIHIVNPDVELLTSKIMEGYQFIAYSTDAFFLINSAKNPISN
jgi:2-dehydro-3-deoxyglucarate aldolase